MSLLHKPCENTISRRVYGIFFPIKTRLDFAQCDGHVCDNFGVII